jgi:DNA transposition AAA+ family ATPase
MPSDTAERLLGEEDIAAIRQEAIAAIHEDGLSRSEAAREAGISAPTFLAFLSGSYTGRNDRVAADTRKWLQSRQEKRAARRAVPAAPAFVETPTAEAVMLQLRSAQHLQLMAVIAGPPGIGKTLAVRAYARTAPNVWIITGAPTLSGPRAVLDAICRVTGLLDNRELHRTHQAIVDKTRGSGGLLVIDEANHLQTVALEQIRAIHDAAQIGVALVGNATVLSRMEGGGRTAEFAQLFSRVGLRLTSPTDHRNRLPRDIDAVLAAWGIEDVGLRRLLQAIGRKPGALRNVSMALRLAHMLAASEDAPLSKAHIAMAWQRLAEATIEPAGGQG